MRPLNSQPSHLDLRCVQKVSNRGLEGKPRSSKGRLGLGERDHSSTHCSPFLASFGFRARSLEAPLWPATGALGLHFCPPALGQRDGSRAVWASMCVSFHYRHGSSCCFLGQLASLLLLHSEGGGKCGMKGGGREVICACFLSVSRARS